MGKYTFTYSVELKLYESKLVKHIAFENFYGCMSKFVRDAFGQLYSKYKKESNAKFMEQYNTYKLCRKKANNDVKHKYQGAVDIHIRMSSEDDLRIKELMSVLRASISDVLRFAIWTYNIRKE